MEKKIVYLKLFQIVLTLTIIWQLISMRQFCGTFTDPKTFLCGLSKGDRYTLIGRDSKTGEVGDAFHHHKWHNQFIMNRSANAPQHQFFDFLLAKMPPAGHECIPITISPFDWFSKWTGRMLGKNLIINGTLFYFSAQLFFALVALGILGYGIMKMRRSMEEYKIVIYWYAFASIFCWCLFVVCSIILVLYWKKLWSFVNFQADETNVPFVTLVLSIFLVLSSIFEIILHKFLLNDVVDTKSANMMIIDQQHQQKKKNGSAFA